MIKTLLSAFSVLSQQENEISPKWNRLILSDHTWTISFTETISNKYNFDLNINIFNIQYGLKVIQEHYKIDEDNLVEKIKIIMHKTGTSKFDHQTRTELKLLLAINFKNWW